MSFKKFIPKRRVGGFIRLNKLGLYLATDIYNTLDCPKRVDVYTDKKLLAINLRKNLKDGILVHANRLLSVKGIEMPYGRYLLQTDGIFIREETNE